LTGRDRCPRLPAANAVARLKFSCKLLIGLLGMMGCEPANPARPR